MKFPWPASRADSASSDPEAGVIPLENMLRLSTETQRRNGFRQSNLPDHGDRIIEDIKNGNYTCSICLDPVTHGDNYEYNNWHCLSCYTVTHFRCAKSWAQARSRSAFSSIRFLESWKCPSCSNEILEPRARCWCQKQSFRRLGPLNIERPNACLDICDRAGTCGHGEENTCTKICHPGPCNIPCKPSCAGRRVLPPTPTGWDRFWARIHQRPAGSIRKFIFFFSLLFAAYALLGVWLHYHIQWWSKPFKYPQLGDSHIIAEIIVLILIGVFVILPLNGILLAALFAELGSFLSVAFNLDSRETKPTRKAAMKFLGRTLLILIAFGIWMLPILGFAGGVDIAWYNQMKGSCNGLKTRIDMDTMTKFTVRSLSPNIVPYDIYLASHLDPVLVPGTGNTTNTTNPFEYYQRLSISRPSPPPLSRDYEHIAIDIDIPSRLYRILHLNASNTENEYMALDYKSSLTSLPTFHPLEETIISNGSFSEVTKKDKHMKIPELNIGIANMYSFIYGGTEQKPFIKIYQNQSPYWRSSAPGAPASLFPMDILLFNKTLNEPWDSKKNAPKDHKLVMRTASFGHGRQQLDMCIAEDTEFKKGIQVSKGVSEEFWVPFAIMVAHRERMWEMEGTK